MPSCATVTRKRQREADDDGQDVDNRKEAASSSKDDASESTRTPFNRYARNTVSPSPSPPAELPPSVKKQLRFATTLDGKVVVETHHYPPHVDKEQDAEVPKKKVLMRMPLPLHNKTKSDLWWTKQEKTLIMEHSRRLAKRFRKTHVQEVEYYHKVYEACAQPPTQESSAFIESATVTVPALVRGLEWCVAPKTKTHSKAHVKDIVQSQRLLWRCTSLGGGEDGSRGRQQDILSARSIRSSRPSRVLARLLGEGDAMSITVAGDKEDNS